MDLGGEEVERDEEWQRTKEKRKWSGEQSDRQREIGKHAPQYKQTIHKEKKKNIAKTTRDKRLVRNVPRQNGQDIQEKEERDMREMKGQEQK